MKIEIATVNGEPDSAVESIVERKGRKQFGSRTAMGADPNAKTAEVSPMPR